MPTPTTANTAPLAAVRRPRSAALAWAGVLRPALVVAALSATLAGHAANPLPAGGALGWLLAAAAAFGAAAGALGAAVGEHEPPVSRFAAGTAAAGLLLAGVAAAAQASPATGWLAIATVTALGAHAAGGRQHAVAGPALAALGLAGLCLMGAAPAGPATAGAAALPFLFYGGAFGVVARVGDGNGGRWAAYPALGLLTAALLLPVLLGVLGDYSALAALPFALALAWWALPDVLWAVTDPRPGPVRTALASGTAAVAALAATLTAGFAGPLAGLSVLALLPIAALLERWLGGE